LINEFQAKVEGDDLAKQSFSAFIEAIWKKKPALIQMLAQNIAEPIKRSVDQLGSLFSKDVAAQISSGVSSALMPKLT
jgi:hypothetical protein